jgi:outer membrane protein
MHEDRKKIILVISALVFGSSLLVAQQSVLTYEEAISIAIEQNRYIKQQSNLLIVSKAEKQQSVAGLFPSVNVNGQGYRTDGRQYSNEKSEMVNTSIDRLTYNIGFEIILFNGFQNIYRLKQSNQLFIAQEKKVESTIQEIIFQVSKQFFQILLDKELLLIAQKDLNAQKKLYEQVEVYAKLGTRTQSDLLGQEAQMRSSQVTFINLQNQLSVDKIDFAKLLVLEPAKEFDLLIPVWNIDSIINQKIALDSLIIVATENHPNIIQLKAEEKAALHAIQISRSNYFPRLSMFYNYGSFYNSDFQRNNNEGDLTYIPLKKQIFRDNYSHIYGFNLTIPLFNKFSHRTNSIRSKINYKNTIIARKDFELQLNLDIQREYHKYMFYKENYYAKKANAEASALFYEKQLELYKMGKSDIVVLSIENQRNIKAQSEKVQAEYTLVFQTVIIDYFTGVLSL